MGGVIQGFFAAGGPRQMPASLWHPVAVHRASQPRSAGRPVAPVPATNGASGIAQRQASNPFVVDAACLGLVAAGGRPLSDAVRNQMEAALGADFSAVRVHVGPQAKRIGAVAFTTGNDIYFAPHYYRPDTHVGQQLLGHELAHVLQQRQGRVRNPLGTRIAVVQDRVLEAEADQSGRRAALLQRAERKAVAQGFYGVCPVRRPPGIATPPQVTFVDQHSFKVGQKLAAHATATLSASRPRIGNLASLIPHARLCTIQMYREYPYREHPWVTHPHRSVFESNIGNANTLAVPLVVQLNNPDEEVDVIQRLRPTLRGYFSPHMPGNTFSQPLVLKAGVYDINLRDANITLVTFRIVVLKPGQTPQQAVTEDVQRLANIVNFLNPITIEKIATPSFIDNHVAEGTVSNFSCELISKYREKNNTLVIMDAMALRNLGGEVQQLNVSDSYNAGQHYTTNDEYKVVDKFNADIVEYTTRFKYSVYFHPQDGLWKVNHFHGIHLPSSKVVRSQVRQTLEFTAPRRNIKGNAPTLMVKVSTPPGALNVTLKIDQAIPVAMSHIVPVAVNQVAVPSDNYSFQWNNIPQGLHYLIAEADINGRKHTIMRTYTQI